VLELGQFSIQAWRRYFQYVVARQRIFNIQQGTYLPAHRLAIGETDSVGLVDEHPEHPAPAALPQLEVGQLVTQSFDGGFQQSGQFSASQFRTINLLFLKRKMGRWPIPLVPQFAPLPDFRARKNPIAGFRRYQATVAGAGFSRTSGPVKPT
jgi:hypothetical protein